MNSDYKRVGLYVRVSTHQQTTENQLIELKKLCDRSNYDIVEIYDETVSGTKNNNDRKEFKRMMNDLKKRKFEKIVVWSLDRIGRKTSELINFLSLCDDYNISLYCYKQNINTEDQMGKMFFSFISIISQYENEMRKERQLIGIERKRSQSKKYNQHNFITDDQKNKVVQLKQKGLTYRKIKNEVNISLSSISQICNSI
jgi:DNA invertase Pin-like site-specific DNA recombinase